MARNRISRNFQRQSIHLGPPWDRSWSRGILYRVHDPCQTACPALERFDVNTLDGTIICVPAFRQGFVRRDKIGDFGAVFANLRLLLDDLRVQISEGARKPSRRVFVRNRPPAIGIEEGVAIRGRVHHELVLVDNCHSILVWHVSPRAVPYWLPSNGPHSLRQRPSAPHLVNPNYWHGFNVA